MGLKFWNKILDKNPCDFHLFRGYTGASAGKDLKTRAEVEQFFNDYVNSKNNTAFFVEGFAQLPMRWEFISDSEGEYYQD